MREILSCERGDQARSFVSELALRRNNEEIILQTCIDGKPLQSVALLDSCSRRTEDRRGPASGRGQFEHCRRVVELPDHVGLKSGFLPPTLQFGAGKTLWLEREPETDEVPVPV